MTENNKQTLGAPEEFTYSRNPKLVCIKFYKVHNYIYLKLSTIRTKIGFKKCYRSFYNRDKVYIFPKTNINTTYS